MCMNRALHSHGHTNTPLVSLQHTKQLRSSTEYAIVLVLEVSAHAFLTAGSSIRADVDCGGGSEPVSVASIPALGRRADASEHAKHARR